MRKLVKCISTLDPTYLKLFSSTYDIPLTDVEKGASYVKAISSATVKKKIIQTLENMKHSPIISVLRGTFNVD